MVGAFKGDNEPEDGYWVCVQVEQFSNIPDGMGTVVVPPQKYAVKWHYGHRSEVSKTHHKLDELIREVGHQVQPMKMGVELFSIIF